MDKELFKERKELEERLNYLDYFIRITEDFLSKNTSHYKHLESIEALKNIRNILTTQEEECKRLHKRHHIVKKSLIESCNHEIIFGDELNTFCAICRTLIVYTPETTQLEITLPGQWEDPVIKSENEFNGKCLRSIIYEIGEEFAYHEDLQTSEDIFEELQYNTNIKIRRLK